MLLRHITEAGSASRSLLLPAYEAVGWGRPQSSQIAAAEVPGIQKRDAPKGVASDTVQGGSGVVCGSNFIRFLVAVGGVVHLFGTPLKENCRAPLAGMAGCKSEDKALGIM